MSGTIYILQDGDFINSDVYKIGKTLCINTRLTQYSKNTVLHHTFCVDENILDKVEKKIIYHFNKKFNIAKGREWFRGNIEKMIQEIKLIIDSFAEEKIEEENVSHICEFCKKEFSNKVNLLRHQETTKSCLKIQGKETPNIECSNCKKMLVVEYYKQHKIKCDMEYSEKIELKEKYNLLEKKYKGLEIGHNNDEKKYKELKDNYDCLNIELIEARVKIELLKDEKNKLEAKLESYEKRLFEMASRPNAG